MAYLKRMLMTDYTIDDFIKWFNSRNFIGVHSFTLYVTLWMTYEAFDWAAKFAFATDKQGAEVALIIGAVTLPITALQGYIFKVYADSRPPTY